MVTCLQVSTAERVLDGVISSNESEMKALKGFSDTNNKLSCLIDSITSKIGTFVAQYFPSRSA